MVEWSFPLKRLLIKIKTAAITAIINIRPAMAIPNANVLGDKQKVSGSSTSSIVGPTLSPPVLPGCGSWNMNSNFWLFEQVLQLIETKIILIRWVNYKKLGQ